MAYLARGDLMVAASDILDGTDETLTTTELARLIVNRLPGADMPAVCNFLRHAAENELRGYATKGERECRKGWHAGKTIRPWFWHSRTNAAPSPALPGHERFATIANAYHAREDVSGKLDDVVNHFNARLDTIETSISELLKRTEMFK